MSALFYRVSLTSNVERFRGLRTRARAIGLILTVKNGSRMRGVPFFIYYLRRKQGEALLHFYSLNDVAAALEGSRA